MEEDKDSQITRQVMNEMETKKLDDYRVKEAKEIMKNIYEEYSKLVDEAHKKTTKKFKLTDEELGDLIENEDEDNKVVSYWISELDDAQDKAIKKFVKTKMPVFGENSFEIQHEETDITVEFYDYQYWIRYHGMGDDDFTCDFIHDFDEFIKLTIEKTKQEYGLHNPSDSVKESK